MKQMVKQNGSSSHSAIGLRLFPANIHRFWVILATLFGIAGTFCAVSLNKDGPHKQSQAH